MTTKKLNTFQLPKAEDFIPTPPARKQLMDARKYLLAAKADEVISKAISKALDDEDKDQGMMIKMLMDRMLPLSEFEARKDGSRNQVTITISGISDAKVDSNDNVVDAEEI